VDDIPALAEYALADFCSRNNFKAKQFDKGVLAVFAGYKWPGNVRELRNTVERMAILASGDLLGVDAIPSEIRLQPEDSSRSILHETRETAERERIRQALEETDWNVSAAARILNIERTNLHKRMRSLGLEREKN
jgi:two-component system nitrogen regulation response regulator NtrX